MSKHGIIVDNVWKKFQRGELHDSLRDLVPALAKRLVGRGLRRDELDADDFWALKEVSFQVGPGEALGIIGPNGSGKSTMLKILNGILRPNRGRVEVNGRIGALIEIAAGFHPDLTGRENIFLQGAIMGMRRAEIGRKFEEIVDFSGIGEFIDTPVKRYSSGMNARLGFSIAAHLDPEVLLIDEVLAVGDFTFQESAFDRLRRVVKSGIPVVVVSHQLHRVASLCDRAILLHQGEVVAQGRPAECIAAYVDGTWKKHGAKSCDETLARRVRIDSFTIDGPDLVTSGDYITARALITRSNADDPTRFDVGVRVRSIQDGRLLYVRGTSMTPEPQLPDGKFEVVFTLQLNLPAGTYQLESTIWDSHEKQTAFPGPTIPVTVEMVEPFRGSVQLNASIVIRREEQATRNAVNE